MTLNEWITQYCEDNEIELPDDIADNDTALNFLRLSASGGGGSSDFSTAEVTFYAPNASDCPITTPYCMDDEYTGIGVLYSAIGDTSYIIPLYKGMGLISINEPYEPADFAVTGGLTIHADIYAVEVRGDGTLTYNGV